MAFNGSEALTEPPESGTVAGPVARAVDDDWTASVARAAPRVYGPQEKIATAPAFGLKTAARIDQSSLYFEMAELQAAATMDASASSRNGDKRLRAVAESLAAAFRRPARFVAAGRRSSTHRFPLTELLSVDEDTAKRPKVNRLLLDRTAGFESICKAGRPSDGRTVATMRTALDPTWPVSHETRTGRPTTGS